MGLNYICATAERFYAVSTVLANMISHLLEQPSIRLLKHIVRCYLRLSDNLRAREALRQCLPDPLRDNSFAHNIKDDLTVKRWLNSLLYNIGTAGATPTSSATTTTAATGGAQSSHLSSSDILLSSSGPPGAVTDHSS
mmetsp:Transcript_22453/g.27944  ORF Transcript_22453/g.27944 Transcript_22453/m.27944 type:complete len:138 (+) Transcript_22453:756-1169(+)